MFDADRPWLEDQPRMKPWDEATRRLIEQLYKWRREYAAAICEGLTDRLDPDVEQRYADRLWACLRHHWLDARAAAEDDRADGDEVAERICGGKGYRGGGRLGGDPLRDVVLAIAMLVKDPRALEVFESDYLKLALKVAGRLNPRFARESDDWWYEWIDFLAGYSDPPGQLEKFYGRAAFPYFLRLTVRNFLRQKYWRRRKEVELESAPVVESSDPLPVKIDIVTEGKMNFARIVHAAVGRLSEVDRLLLALMVVDGLNKQEAAAFVDLSSGQAGRRIKKSLETIHKETRRLAEQHFGDGAFEGMLDGIEYDPRTFADALYGALRKFMEER